MKIEIVEFPDLTGDKQGIKVPYLVDLATVTTTKPSKGGIPSLLQNVTGEVTVSC